MELTADSFLSNLAVRSVGQDSDHLLISLTHTNIKIADQYLNTLISEFDRDGINDRQLEYKRTMDLWIQMSFFPKELEKIELKQEFKEKNNLSDITADAAINVNQQFSYDSELFKAESQKDLIRLLKETISEEKYSLMPVNIRIDNDNINNLVAEYNLIINERERYLISAGPKTPFILNLEKQIDDYFTNISISLENYDQSLDLIIENLSKKENEFANIFQNIPQNEKILRSIERELGQGVAISFTAEKEEAAINFAVIKPSIKVIDNARTFNNSKYPKDNIVYLMSAVFGFFIPTILLYIWFVMDSKIHTKEMLLKGVNNKIPVIGEIPFFRNKDNANTIISSASEIHIESIRMIVSNLNFVLLMILKRILSRLIFYWLLHLSR